MLDALLLPALSSISTRDEMRPLAAELADGMCCSIPDWPGFGARPRGDAPLCPATMRAFLDGLVAAFDGPTVGIAAGHAATYLVEAAGRHPGCFERLILIAPTWRGPLPTMLKGRYPAMPGRVRRTMEMPVLGDALYRLNLSDFVIGRMMREHVYADPAHVTAALLAAKRIVAHQPRARFGTAAFVTGALDPVASREAFLELFRRELPPTLLLRPAGAPKRSGAEMDAVAQTGRVSVVSVPGALAAHEEYPAEVASAIRD